MISSLCARLGLPSSAELESAQLSGSPEPIRELPWTEHGVEQLQDPELPLHGRGVIS
jgi:hypothetical protein